MEETFAKYINVNGELMDLSRPPALFMPTAVNKRKRILSAGYTRL